MPRRPGRPPQAAPARRPRLARFDAARFLAAAAVVWVHAAFHAHAAGGAPLRELGSFAVPFFTVAAIFFTAGSVGRRAPSLASHVGSRFLRLYGPFAAWSVVYAAVRAVQARGHGLGTTVGYPLLYNGGSYHLWFLPYIFVVTAAVYPLAVLLSRRPSLGTPLAAAAAAAGAALVLVPTPRAFDPESFFALRCAWPQLASVCWGVALASVYYTGGRAWLEGRSVGRVGAALVLCGLAAPLAARWEPVLNLASNVAGLGLAVWSLAPTGGGAAGPSRAESVLAGLGRTSYGIYLSHALFVGVLRAATARRLPESYLSTAVFIWAAGLAGSLLLTLLLTRVRWLRWLIA